MLEDSNIVDLFLKRDENAISETKEKYGKKVNSLSYKITENLETAEECENDTYLECWNLIPPNEPRSYFLPFLLKIVRNISLNRIMYSEAKKRSGNVVELTSELYDIIPDSFSVEKEAEKNHILSLIEKFLKSEKKEKRTIFISRYFFMLSIKEISNKLGFSESKVKTTLLRMRNDLKIYLEREGYNI